MYLTWMPGGDGIDGPM